MTVPKLTRSLDVLRLSLLLTLPVVPLAARAGTIGYLWPREQEMQAEATAAHELCGRLGTVVPLRFSASGGLTDISGQAVADPPAVIWIHAGDSTDLAPLVLGSDAQKTIRDYVRSGGALYLSGAAPALLHELGIEPTTPRRGGPGQDRNAAALRPVVSDHPIFEGIRADNGLIHLSDAGYPAFADWHATGGPRKGGLLAKTPSGSENPLVEFSVSKGRIIAMGWRLPHYAHGNNRYRKNLERLTANILSYLGTPKTWQPIVLWKEDVKRSTPKTPPDWDALELAIRDLITSFHDRYPEGATHLKELHAIQSRYRDTKTSSEERDAMAVQFTELQRRALLTNPLLDVDRILLVKRGAAKLGLPANWQGNCSMGSKGYDNALVTLDLRDEQATLTPLYQPPNAAFIGDVDLHHDAHRMLVSMPGSHDRWRIHEIGIDGKSVRELPLINDRDVDNYDACYLPDGNIIFSSTATFTGVPCVRGSAHVANLYLFNASGDGSIRRLTFDQDHDWCPTVLNNGRVLYLRWEYSDIPHFVSRILFHMNPDGTEQMEYYGSNSYWPNAMFYARPVPDHPSRFIAIVGGHHDVPRMGELVLFDPALGRREADGVLQRIPGRKAGVEPVILDGLVGSSWPKFLHPWPLSSSHFLVAAKPSAQSNWGLYLADVFDNLVLIKEEPGYALLEPIPIRPTPRAPIITPKVDTTQTNALIYVADVYAGPGLRGIPRGTVKQLRLFTYHFSYRGMGGQVDRVGLDGPWDVKRIIGTVPVEADGSAYFRVPANTPISMQPLDQEGKALQLMRSWMTAMPGETLSCVGCHESQNTPPPTRRTVAQQHPPANITPWYGPTRGFSFVREIQPVLDAHCVRCHDGSERKNTPAKSLPDFSPHAPQHPPGKNNAYLTGSQFTPAYLALRRYVRSPTIESDMHLLPPCEFHADTSELVQILREGHHGVHLDPEAWDRLITWIDLGTPAHGTWHENCGWDRVRGPRDRRRELMARYANRDEDPESTLAVGYVSANTHRADEQTQPRETADERPQPVAFDYTAVERTLDLGQDVLLTMCNVPGRRFWIGKFEVTNEQFARFDAMHDSRLEHGDFLQFSIEERGYPVNAPHQPVARVSWHQATAFCRWLSEKTGENVSLPTGSQWEYACRAGTTTAMSYGAIDTDFTPYANLADKCLLKVDTFPRWSLPSGAIYEWRPAAGSLDDGYRVSAPVGSYQPNAWGLHDMHGNVAEWTLTAATPDDTRMTVRGGSWYRRPHRAQSCASLAYHGWQGVFDVGFRVVCNPQP